MKEEAREEYPLGLSDKVYIGNRPAEPGTYDRYWITEIDGKKHITLRRLDCTTEEFNPQVTPVFLEYHSRRRFSTDTTIEEGNNVFNEATWGGMEPVSVASDKYCSDIFKPKLLGIGVPNGVPNNENFTLLTADSLKEMGSHGVFLNNCGQKDYCPAERLIYILIDHTHQQFVICRKGPEDRSRYSTYSLPKITSIRFSPKKK